jgi:L-threonylcarbamoyladenylate synthase
LECVDVLRDGGVAVIPTDTVYGLACSVLHEDAVARVFQVKRRAPDAAVPILLSTAADLPLLAAEVPRIAWRLIDRFWPGPLTLVFTARSSVSQTITGGTGTVALRVPASLACLRVLELLAEPVIGTSANRSGEPAADTAATALEAIGSDVDVVLEDDASVVGGLPSTVVSLASTQPVVHRIGSVSVDAVRAALGTRVLLHQELTGHRTGG